MVKLSLLSCSSLHFLSLTKKLTFTNFTIPTRTLCSLPNTMSINLQSHAFAGNPIRSKTPKPSDPFSSTQAYETLKTQLLDNTHLPNSSPSFKVLPLRKGRPLASTSVGINGLKPNWNLGWISLGECRGLLGDELSEDSLVYLGSRPEEDVVYWGVDVSKEDSVVGELSKKQLCFVELRTLMVATDWADGRAMAELAIAGHARALLEWHSTALFCGHCGAKTVPKEAGKRKQCSSELCRRRVYPRVDPV